MLSIPLTSSGEAQRYADKFPIDPDLSNTTLTVRVYAPGASNGTVTLYVVDKNFDYGPRNDFVLDTLSQGWTDLTISIGGADTSFDATSVAQVNFEVTATGSGPWAEPTLIYVDGIRTANGAVHDTFDASYGSWVTSTLLVVSGSSFSWSDKMPAEAPDSGA